MTVVNQIFDAFYTRLVLRDVFGKAFPGLIVLLAIDASYEWNIRCMISYASLLEVGGLVAASWILGLTVQSLGEVRNKGIGRLIYDLPPLVHEKSQESSNIKKRGLSIPVERTLRTLFRQNTSKPEDSDQRIQYERFVVIKEACGNTYVAIMLCAAVHTMSYTYDHVIISGLTIMDRIQAILMDLADNGPLLILGLVTVWALRIMHIKHVERQYEHVLSVLDGKNIDYPPHKDTMPRPNPPWFWVGIPIFYSVVGFLGVFLGWLSRFGG